MSTFLSRAAQPLTAMLAGLFASSCAGTAALDPPVDAAMGSVEAPAGQGTYRFDDGHCVTGGRFDESGSQRLLLTDVWRNSRGGLFEGDGASFRSLMDPRTTLAFRATGNSLAWTTGKATDHAERVHAARSIDVRFDNADAELDGTLHLPEATTAAPYPGLVLAHGSGPQNRHAGPWASFFVDLGFAVLSYDKRGVGESGGNYDTLDYALLEEDLAAAVRWLANRPEVDAARVGIHATSQSGWYAPSVAADAPLAFLLVRAGPSLGTGPTTSYERVQEWRAEGLDEKVVRQASQFWTKLVEIASQDAPLATAQSLLDETRPHAWFEAAFGGWSEIRGEWWRQQRVNARYQPALDLAMHPVPTLWFLADNDQNVPYEASAQALRGTGLPPSVLTLVTVEGAGHDFLVRAEDGSIRYTDQYWPVMARWLEAHGFDGPKTPAMSCAGAGRQ